MKPKQNLHCDDTLLKDHPVIVLSAGAGSRAGVSKGLLRVEDKPWITSQLERLSTCGLSSAVVVLGYQQVDYFSVCSALEKAVRGEISVFGLTLKTELNPNPERGAFSSLICGVRRVLDSISNQGAFILPVDVPCPNREVWSALLVRKTETARASIPTWQNRGGHPVWLKRDFLERLVKIEPFDDDARLDRQIQKLPTSEISRISINDPLVTFNFNYARDWIEWSALKGHQPRS